MKAEDVKAGQRYRVVPMACHYDVKDKEVVIRDLALWSNNKDIFRIKDSPRVVCAKGLEPILELTPRMEPIPLDIAVQQVQMFLRGDDLDSENPGDWFTRKCIQRLLREVDE